MLVSRWKSEVVAAPGGVVAEADAGAGVVAAGPGVDADAGADLDVGGEGDAGDGGLLGVGRLQAGLAEDARRTAPRSRRRSPRPRPRRGVVEAVDEEDARRPARRVRPAWWRTAVAL